MQTEGVVINEILCITQAVKRHLSEVPDCTHDLKSIVKEALESKSAGSAKTQTQQTTPATTPHSNRAQTRQEYLDYV